MRDETKQVLGFEGVTITGIPETNEEFDINAKKQNAACEEGVDHIIAHSTYGIVRRMIASKLEEKSGIKRLTETRTVEGKEVTTVIETDGEYVKRVCGADHLDTDINEIGLDPISIAFDASIAERKERVSGPKRVGKDYTNSATAIIDKGDEAAQSVAAQLNVELTGDRETDINKLAVAIRNRILEVEKQTKAALGVAV